MTLDLDADDALLHEGFVFRMVLQHEYQHNKTILQSLQLKKNGPYEPVGRLRPPPPPQSDAFDDIDMADFPGGWVEIGTNDRSGIGRTRERGCPYLWSGRRRKLCPECLSHRMLRHDR